ncbi:MAG: polysaccharide biosynthesis protein, partial [Gammaproteobacteria bacterium]
MNPRIRSPYTAFLHDLLAIPVAWYMAFWLRFNLGEIPAEPLATASGTLPLLIVVHGALFWFFGLYRGVWRFASLPDMLRIGQAVMLGVLISAAVLFMATRMDGIPRSVFPLFAVMLAGFLAVPRFVYRMAKDHRFRPQPGKRVLIVGAGPAGEMLVRDLFRQSERRYNPVAFVDDNLITRGKEIHGVRVLGGTQDIGRIVSDKRIDVILLALPTIRGSEMRRIIEQCEMTGVTFRIVPPTEDLVSGRTQVSELREVSIEDLLGRDPVSLDWDRISSELSGRRVLVTGGGGSIGSELCRQISRLSPAKLIIVDQSEFNLYAIEMELRQSFPSVELYPRLVDVTDPIALEQVFEEFKPQVVFHAAAYKHVPMLEDQVREAVSNNILGTRRTALAADRHGVECFVLISTDKAVNPANVMGTTKRISEIFCQNLDCHSKTHFITVRFGNVLGSAGSVVPLFRKQIAEGGPVTVTHPDILRYFMTITEASQLILEASS